MSGKIIVNVNVTADPRTEEEGELFAVPINFTLENKLTMIRQPAWNEEKANLQKEVIGQVLEYLLALREWPCSCCYKRPAVYMSGSPILRFDQDTGIMGWDTLETPHCAHSECIMEIRKRYKSHMKAFQRKIGKDVPWTQMCGHCKRIGVIDHETTPEGGLLRCGGCRMVWYCNKDCQKAHWKQGHKEECKAAQLRKLKNKPSSNL